MCNSITRFFEHGISMEILHIDAISDEFYSAYQSRLYNQYIFIIKLNIEYDFNK